MADEVSLPISAVHDLEMERELLTRANTEIPVTLGWHTELTLLKGVPEKLEVVEKADLHFFILGSDIWAPFDQEWYAASRDKINGGVILSRERCVRSEGVLVNSDKQENITLSQ